MADIIKKVVKLEADKSELASVNLSPRTRHITDGEKREQPIVRYARVWDIPQNIVRK